MDCLVRPYVTARGVDLVETEADAPLLLDGRPLLDQRHWGVRTSSLSKTAVTTVPLTWSPGFHSATVRPAFDDLSLVHTKFADVKGRVAWFEEMSTKVRPVSNEAAYYSDGRAKLEGYNRFLHALKRDRDVSVLDSDAFDEAFLATVTCNVNDDVHQGDFTAELVLRRCEFRGA